MNVSDEGAEEMIPTERSAKIVWLLCKGHQFTTLEVSIIAGITRQGAHAMLSKMSRVIPLAGPDKGVGNVWHMLADDE